MLEFLTNTFYGNTIAAWFNALIIILGSIILGKITYWVFGNIFKKISSKTKTKLDDIIIDMIEEPIVFAIFLVGVWFAVHQLTFPEHIFTWINNVYKVLIVLNIAWLITRLFDSLCNEYLVPLADKTDSDLDDQLLPIVRKGTKAIIWIIAIIVALNNAGYNISALLAGLGIGGLALAMAAKDTIENVFGGFTIFTDKPFTLNQRVKINGYDGFIREIGIRSTRLETLEGRIVTIPNSQFATSPVENITVEPNRKIILNLGLNYNTSPKNIEKAMKLLKTIANKNPNLKQEVLISFNNFGDSTLNIIFIYYIKKGKNILQTQTDMNLEILKQFNKNKLDFAFPSQTIYKGK